MEVAQLITASAAEWDQTCGVLKHGHLSHIATELGH